MAAARPSEDELIARYFRPLAGAAALGLLDDAACLPAEPGSDVVMTADALVAGVHFFPHDPPDAIGWKALAVNLSDLAAKAAEPRGFLLSLALSPGWTPEWLDGFAAGLGEAAREGGCPLLGGDTVRTPGPLTLSITAVGSVPSGRMVARTGARPGDRLYVSGTIGDAALGLKLRLAEEPRRAAPGWAAVLDGEGRGHLLDRYLRPRPRLALREALRACANGAMDVSDGLVGDLAKMAAASGVGASLDVSRVPLSPGAAAAVSADRAALAVAVTGGDDYEVLCSVPAVSASTFESMARAAGVAVTAVGDTVAGGGLSLTDAGTAFVVQQGSFSHF
ncbi:MAG: thiamine-phosphate kinase [Alsobacter sp.]